MSVYIESKKAGKIEIFTTEIFAQEPMTNAQDQLFNKHKVVLHVLKIRIFAHTQFSHVKIRHYLFSFNGYQSFS